METHRELSDLIKRYAQYRLRPFGPILSEMLGHFETLDDLKGRSVLELGPGNRVDMMRFLAQETEVSSIRGAGKSILWPWTRQQAFIRAHVENVRLLDFMARQKDTGVYDLIYSRQVMEQHSIDPWVLVSSPAYRRQFKKKKFTDFDESYPGSVPNLQAIFRHAWALLRPGATIISQIGKRKYSALDRDFLEGLKPRRIRERNLGRLSCVIVLTK